MRPHVPMTRSRLTTALAGTVLMLSLAACGSTESDSGADDSSDAGSGAAASSDLPAEASQRLDQAMQPVAAFPGPTDPISPESGTKVTVIECSAIGESCVETANGAKAAGESLGWDVTVVDGKGNPTDWNAALSAALAGGTQAVILSAVPPALVQAGMDQAAKDGVPVIYAHGLDAQGATALVAVDRAEQGRVIADYIAQDSGGTGKVLLLRDQEFPELEVMDEEFKKELGTACPDCEIAAEQQFTLGAMTTDVPTIVQGALQADPDIDYVFSPYDAAATFVNQGIRASGQSGVKLVATGGGTSAVKLIEDGQLDATAGVPSTWLGYQAIDAIARTLAGQPVPDVPVVSGLLVKDNVADQAATGTYDGGFDYAAAYEKLWGK
jgi:ribose transport system substrate-binding protein